MSTTTIATAPRYTAERIDGDWTVVRTDDTGRQGVGTYPSREQARQVARERNEGARLVQERGIDPAQVAAVAEGYATDDEGWDDEVLVPSVEEEAARDEADRLAAEVAAEHAAVDNDNAAQAAADVEHAGLSVEDSARREQEAYSAVGQVYNELHPVKTAGKFERTSLARVKVGDRLMTNLVTDGTGVVYVKAHRRSDGQVRTVAEVTTRKAEAPEMPGTLYTLVFEDGTVSEERYGTTSHYLAEAFTGEVAPEKPVPAPEPTPAPVKPTKAPKAKPAPKEKVATTASRANKLVKGSRLVLRDLGVVTVDAISKTGEGRLEVAYTTADGEAGVREMWGSTNVRLAADA